MAGSPPPPNGLVVPIDVAVFCVGMTDPQRTNSFAGTTVDYSALTSQNPQAFLGGAATVPLDNSALIPIGTGVHLHWALPDALTHATDTSSGLSFPAVPNRWLITRLVLAGDNFTAQSYVIESDALNGEAPSSTAMTIPVKPLSVDAVAGPLPDFEYLGKTVALADYTNARVGRSLREGTGFELTAVSNGVPSFGSYYPESRNSFGFWDQLGGSGLPAQAQLAYVMTGWYQEPDNDPAHIAAANALGSVRAALSDTRKWHTDSGTDPDYTLYSGFVSGIGWNQNTPYVPANPKPIVARAALGNTPAEALAAYFVQDLKLTSPEIEQLLTAFQQGLWPRLSQPQSEMMDRLLEMLHDSQFRRLDAGTDYAIYQTTTNKTAEAITLPIGIADKLDSLNTAADELSAATDAVEAFRWRVFADWYRYFLTTTQAPVFTHLTQVLFPLWSGDSGLQARLNNAKTARDNALTDLQAALANRPDLAIREVPAPRFQQPNDPVLLLNASDLATPQRYGGDGNYRADGQLACRSTADIISALTVNGTPRAASAYAAAANLGSAPLPHRDVLSALIAEACLLNCDSAAAWSGVAVATLVAKLKALLDGNPGENNPWQITSGKPPSPVEAVRWDGNPWLPIFLMWDTGFAPMFPTGGGTQSYSTDFFTTNFTVDPKTSSFVSYTAQGGIDPSKADYSADYVGYTFLSDRAAQNLIKQIEKIPIKDRDKTLDSILAALKTGGFTVQPLTGFDAALLTSASLMQVAVVAPPKASVQVRTMTNQVRAILNRGQEPVTWDVTPLFAPSYYNPIRAGFLNLNVAGSAFTLYAVDAFGQRRQILFPGGVNVPAPAIAASMAASPPGGSIEPGYAYAAPRLAQPARLMFQWIAAASDQIRLLDDHSASTPICGWLLPNHLTRGLYLYNAAGRPLGSLFIGGDDASAAKKVIWQGAPGNDADIDQTIEQDVVLAAADARIRALALQLGLHTSIKDFQAFYHAVDTAYAAVDPGDATSDAGVAVLIGRPVAVVQASLRLDLQGPPSLSQNSANLSSTQWTDSDAGLSGVTFPVALGNLDRLDDGLIGFFRQAGGGGYDLTTFYSQAATAGSNVVPPTPTTLLLTTTPTLPGQLGQGPYEQQRMLMLVDPRAPVHAITGILPTQTLVVPPDRAAAAIATLEFSVAVAPTLRANSGLALPLASEPGFEASFLEQQMEGSDKRWVTLPEITPSVANAVWDYTPQSLTEGWLRFNPSVLTAALLNAAGQPLAQGGQVQTMTLQLVNRAPIPITFTAGTLVPESQPPAGSIFYIHLGKLIDAPDWSNLTATAPGWIFKLYADDVYGHYLAATSLVPVTLEPFVSGASASSASTGSMIEITLGNLKASAAVNQAHISVDYYDVEAISDGVAGNVVTVNQPHHAFIPGRVR